MVRAHVANLQEGSEGDRPLALVHRPHDRPISGWEGEELYDSMAKIGIYGKVNYGHKNINMDII
jgi:hypothetical protein